MNFKNILIFVFTNFSLFIAQSENFCTESTAKFQSGNKLSSKIYKTLRIVEFDEDLLYSSLNNFMEFSFIKNVQNQIIKVQVKISKQKLIESLKNIPNFEKYVNNVDQDFYVEEIFFLPENIPIKKQLYLALSIEEFLLKEAIDRDLFLKKNVDNTLAITLTKEEQEILKEGEFPKLSEENQQKLEKMVWQISNTASKVKMKLVKEGEWKFLISPQTFLLKRGENQFVIFKKTSIEKKYNDMLECISLWGKPSVEKIDDTTFFLKIRLSWNDISLLFYKYNITSKDLYYIFVEGVEASCIIKNGRCLYSEGKSGEGSQYWFKIFLNPYQDLVWYLAQQIQKYPTESLLKIIQQNSIVLFTFDDSIKKFRLEFVLNQKALEKSYPVIQKDFSKEEFSILINMIKDIEFYCLIPK